VSSDSLVQLKARIAKAPSKAGVYRWIGSPGDILYVGKAKNLRKRLQSYVSKTNVSDGPWKKALRAHIKDFDVTVTGSELEALVLETNLIKQHRPKYNVMMKDDKNYVYVRISNQEFPKVEIVRQMEHDGARYFGPFLSSFETRRTLDMLDAIFHFRVCGESLRVMNHSEAGSISVPKTNQSPVHQSPVARLRPCLDFHIGKCAGLCAGAIAKEQYRESVEHVADFFRGDRDPVRRRTQELMKEAAAARKFEKAAHLRDVLAVIDAMEETQRVSDPSEGDSDVWGVALLSGRAQAVLMRQRSGRIIGEQSMELAGFAETVAEVLEQILPQYYDIAADIPPLILVPEEPADGPAIEALLRLHGAHAVTLRAPERGKKSKLLELAKENAERKAEQREAKWEAEARNTKNALEELQQTLCLPSAPVRIECYDISHLGGTETVGSMAVALGGKVQTAHYRSFTLRTIKEGVIDDYRALREVLLRRLKHLKDIKEEEKAWKEEGITFGKARKADLPRIIELFHTYADDIGADNIPVKDFLVARHSDVIVAFARFFPLKSDKGSKSTLTLLRSVLVVKEFRGQRLGQFLVRKMLTQVKKGKIYITINPELEEYYAQVGFRHVIKHPPAIDEFLRSHSAKPDTLVMMYEAIAHKPDASLASRPDLILIDGGKGQLATAVEAVSSMLFDIPIASLAKREEEVFITGHSDPVHFPKESQGKFLLMRLRDEAHRFANRHREKRISKKIFA
jgi:excinuclease ABC subunit C